MNTKPSPGTWKVRDSGQSITGPGVAWKYRMVGYNDIQEREAAEHDAVLLISPSSIARRSHALLAMFPKSESGEANAAFTVAAHKACVSINPDNPLAVAEALPELVKIIDEMYAEVDGDERFHYPAANTDVNAPLALIQCHLEGRMAVLKTLRAALAKAGAKP